MKHLAYLSVFVFFTIAFYSCGEKIKKNSTHQNIPDASILKGKALAEKFCQSCHLLPDPSLMDAEHWQKGILPAMGPRLGIFSFKGARYNNNKFDLNVPKDFYPLKPQVTEEEWQNIIDYFTAVSPDQLEVPKRTKTVLSNKNLFRVEAAPIASVLPTVSYVHIDTSAAPVQILFSDIKAKNLSRFNNQFKLIDTLPAPTPITDVDINGKQFTACNIGVLNPNNGRFGFLQPIKLDQNGKMTTDALISIKNLYRPVQVSSADFNADGKSDYLVCEFGNLEGALSWMENKGAGQYERHVMRGLPGAIKAYIKDVNNDGLPDVWALFSQGEEGIFLFTNKGNGEFKEEEVLRFPSIYGSSYFELADFNKDGIQDILYTCGDNADYSTVLKPYHGVYIYINDGTNHFKQQYFFQLNGCFKAMARDFDGDGDLDIAAMSFFADYQKHPEESFIYLDNKGGFNFNAFSIPGTEAGRWLVMDAGDIDGDKKTDIILGNFGAAPSFIESNTDWKKGPALLVLKNIMGK